MTTQNNYWSTKNIVITGGSSGLGKELAKELQKEGANVMVIARRYELLKLLQKENPEIHILQGDISDKSDSYRLAAEISKQFSKIDYLFNNASYLGKTPLRMLMDTECEDLELSLQTNLIGPFRLTKILLSSMILNKNGNIVNISSDAAVSAYPTWGSYSISKAAMDHLSNIWQEELKPHGIRFVALDPGDMSTPMHFDAIPDANPEELRDPIKVAREMIKFLTTKTSRVRYSAQGWRLLI